MQIYYINLASRSDRRAFMERQLADLGLSATRLEAVSPAQLTVRQLDTICNPRRGHWLEPGALCCSLSHLEVARRVAADTQPFALVLEDDLIVSSRLPAFLEEFESRSAPIDILRIETTIQDQRLLPSETSDIAGVSIMRTFGWAGGAGGYILSRHAARIVAESRELERKVADQVLLDPYEPLARRLTLRQCNPGLVVQQGNLESEAVVDLGSDIEHNSRDAAERPYFWRRLPFVIARWIHRDIVVAAQKAWHQYVRGARKQHIPFLP